MKKPLNTCHADYMGSYCKFLWWESESKQVLSFLTSQIEMFGCVGNELGGAGGGC